MGFFMINMFLVIAGCSEEAPAPSPPVHTRGGPMFGQISWWSSSDVAVDNLGSALDEWSHALECGITGRRVGSREDATVVFESGEVPEAWDDIDVGYFSIVRPTLNDPRKRVILDEWNTEDLARGQALHVWGHVLGYIHRPSGRPSVLNSVPIMPIDRKDAEMGIQGDELESLKAWSLEMGAPGCDSGN